MSFSGAKFVVRAHFFCCPLQEEFLTVWNYKFVQFCVFICRFSGLMFRSDWLIDRVFVFIIGSIGRERVFF